MVYSSIRVRQSIVLFYFVQCASFSFVIEYISRQDLTSECIKLNKYKIICCNCLVNYFRFIN